MCFDKLFGTPKPPAVQRIAAPVDPAAGRAADLEASLRRRRAGAAMNILTSPVGIPAKTQLGAPA